MAFLKNNPALKEHRRALRRDQTDAEKTLWSKLRNKQFHGLKFFRKYSIGPYILDCYCPEKRLAVELDGGQHNLPDVREYDAERTSFLNSHGVTVVRFWNNEVLREIDGVFDQLAIIVASNPSRPPLTSRGGEKRSPS